METTLTTTAADATTAGHAIAARLGLTVSDARAKTLVRCADAGATDAQLKAIASAELANSYGKIKLPAHRYEMLSRGRGWCRSADGVFANDRDGSLYVVTEPGQWTVGASDGFSRKDKTTYRVQRMQIGALCVFIAA
jgi:hypothetical protein